jgi:hypothetical protein
VDDDEELARLLAEFGFAPPPEPMPERWDETEELPDWEGEE